MPVFPVGGQAGPGARRLAAIAKLSRDRSGWGAGGPREPRRRTVGGDDPGPGEGPGANKPASAAVGPQAAFGFFPVLRRYSALRDLSNN
jgi:hypothetical protein